MVPIANDINKDLDKYISARRASDDWSFFSSRRKPVKEPKRTAEKVPEDMEVGEVHVLPEDEPRKRGFWARLFSGEEEPVSEDLTPQEMAKLDAMQDEIEQVEMFEEEHPEMESELEEVRETLWERFTGMFRFYEQRHRLDRRAEQLSYVEKEVIPQVDADVRQVLKIVHAWLEKLPQKEKSAFKKSNDFQQYKAVLEKYGLAKPALSKMAMTGEKASMDPSYPDLTSLRKK